MNVYTFAALTFLAGAVLTLIGYFVLTFLFSIADDFIRGVVEGYRDFKMERERVAAERHARRASTAPRRSGDRIEGLPTRPPETLRREAHRAFRASRERREKLLDERGPTVHEHGLS